MIRVSDLYKTFHAGKVNEVKALSGLNLQVERGEFAVIIGSNGSGKSTLLNLLAGSIRPSEGSVFIGGRDVSRLPEYRRSPYLARVFQNPLQGTASELSVLENFRLAAIRTSSKTLKTGISEAFRQQVRDRVGMLGMGLEDKLGQAMGTLSGGQRQALSVLMCVMDNVDVLLLDEPTAALDPRSAEVVLKTAADLIKTLGLTALMVTHNLKDAWRFGNRLIQMEEGHIIRDLKAADKSMLKPEELYNWFA